MEKLARIDQILASLGYGSRREAKALIKASRVTVEGQRVRDTGFKTRPELVRLDGEPLADTGGILILLHKPAGYVCSHDSREGPRIYDLLPPRWLQRNPVPTTIGRLDKDTTGALIVTDDAALVHQLTSPRHKVPKVYRVALDGPAEADWIAQLSSGEFALPGEEDKPCAPAELTILEPSVVELTLTEGRYHQVKRMFAALGRTVTQLHRRQFSGLSADHLEPGQWQPLTRAQLDGGDPAGE